jgi:hypothetical protein
MLAADDSRENCFLAHCVSWLNIGRVCSTERSAAAARALAASHAAVTNRFGETAGAPARSTEGLGHGLAAAVHQPGSHRALYRAARELVLCGLNDSSLVQKLDGRFILAMLPHEREKPNTTLANPEVRGCEPHLRAEWLFSAFRRVFGLPSEQLTLPMLASGVKMVGK